MGEVSLIEQLQGWTTRIPLPLNIKNLEAKFVSNIPLLAEAAMQMQNFKAKQILVYEATGNFFAETINKN